MKTFAEMMPTATAEMREFVEAYIVAFSEWRVTPYKTRGPGPFAIMQSTPPAKEPVSVEGVIRDTKYGFFVRLPSGHAWIGGNRVLITKQETT